jgi:hypothetical protein
MSIYERYFVSKLETLIEQTTFLIEKQEEAKKDCARIFSDFIATVDKKAQSCKNAEEISSFKKIHALTAEQAKRCDDETQEDIDFLSEQLKMLQQARTITDKEKAKEIIDMIVDEDEEILDTEEFKRTILEEGALSKQNLITMVNDITDALNEGSTKEVELLLENILLDQEESGEGDDEDSCECGGCDEQDDEDSCCSQSGKGHGCCGKQAKGADIFAEFSDYAETIDGKNKKTNKK